MLEGGFFTNKQIESKSRPGGRIYSCVSCGLLHTANTPKMEPYGNFRKGIMNIGVCPTKVDDERGIPWQGKNGRYLKRVYKKLGVDLFEDCINVYTVLCHPINKDGNDREPLPTETVACRKTLLKWIEEFQPKVIVLMGDAPLTCLLGHRWEGSLEGISKWRGFRIPEQHYKSWVCPTYDPDKVRKWGGVYEVIFENDLRQALIKLQEPFLKYKKPEIQIIEDLSVLNTITSGLISIDYETTGLKPDADGHRIICASVAYHADKCYSFMMPNKKRLREPFLKLLKNLSIGKMAHNIKYEDVWSRNRLQRPVINWEWDSMVAAHIMDNRPGITGLKFQTYVNFGVADYNSEVAPYLRAAVDGGNELNRIMDLLKLPGGQLKLLEYCGLDTIFQYRLAMQQQKEMNYSFLPF